MVAGAAHAARAASLRRPMTQPSRAALAAAFAAVYLIWGSTYLAIRWGVAEIPPFLMAGGRFVGAGLVFVAWAACRGAARPTARDWLATALIGLLMAAGGNGLITWALQRVPSGLGALLVAMVPFWVTLADWLRPRGARPPGRPCRRQGWSSSSAGFDPERDPAGGAVQCHGSRRPTLSTVPSSCPTDLCRFLVSFASSSTFESTRLTSSRTSPMFFPMLSWAVLASSRTDFTSALICWCSQ